MFKAQHTFLEKSDVFSLNSYSMENNSYCLCGQPYDPNIFMIQCDACKDWFHSICCNFPEYTAIEIDKYHCPRCVPTFGPSINKPICNWHRHDFWDDNSSTKLVQTGTTVFIKELCARHFSTGTDTVLHIGGYQLTETFLETHGFNRPVVVDNKEGLDLKMPPDSFSVFDVEQFVGGEFEIDVIDVCRQNNVKMKLREYVEYFNRVNRNRVFNVVSLEFSSTRLSSLVEAPSIARSMDWVNVVWPPNFPGKPQVQKYCLMSVKDSYTDFHIDFGGTSVWYHVLKGEKIFYFVKPTPANMTLYSQWMTSTNQSETFFGDQVVDQCIKCVIRKGQTMLIPTGWIHAVYTPVDSIVFGGNFLHSLNISMQLRVYEIEKKIKTELRFLYPNFEMINWFAATYLLDRLIEINMQESRCPEYFLVGIKSLLHALKHWNTEKDYNLAVREQIPHTINISKLIKDLGKEIRHAERYIIQLNPPKPERESKRKRKKPVNKDFVDYSLLPKGASHDFMPLTELPPPPSTPIKYSRQTSLKLTLPKPAMYPYERSGTSAEDPTLLDQSRPLDTEQWLNMPFDRPQETVAIHRGGTVLKFKLGPKDIMAPPPIPNVPPSDYVFRGDLGGNSQDIYDFHDESDRDEDCFNFTIDESPPKKPKKALGKRTVAKKNKLIAGDLDGSNGIESLIQASALSVPLAVDGGTSPSTQEAIAGMLSISQTWTPTKGQKRQYVQSPIEENVSNVHQDDDYIYPSLDNSDDDDVHIFKPRGRSKVDEAWNPKARVGPLLPKMNRPAREGTKKQSVEKVLEAAAARRLNEIPEKVNKFPKRQYRRRKIKPKLDMRSPSTSGTSITSTSSAISATPSSSASNPASKPRKGMKTVKQRLGKILKIHKMIH